MRGLQKQRGFTIVELVSVVVIIGVLSAAAIPLMSNLYSQSYDAAIDATKGSLGIAIQQAHVAWIAAGAPNTATTIMLENGPVLMNSNGWPAGGMGTTVNSDAVIATTRCQIMINSLLTNPPITVISGGTCPDTEPVCFLLGKSGAANGCTIKLRSYGRNTQKQFTYNVGNGTFGS